jgi:hypothetical protein
MRSRGSRGGADRPDAHRSLTLHVRHPNYAWQNLCAATTARPTNSFDYPRESVVGDKRPPVATGDLNLTLYSTRLIALRVVSAASGQPAARLRVSATEDVAMTGSAATGFTDDEGKHQLRLPPGEYQLTCDPTDRSADVLRTRLAIKVTAEPAEQSLEVRVNAGCVVQFEVVDAKTGKGIPGVGFMRQINDSGGLRMAVQTRTGMADEPVTDANGRLRAVVEPGLGAFTVGLVPESTGYKPSSVVKRVDLSAGGTVTVRFELAR